MTDNDVHKNDEKLVAIVLAEFNALRSEIVQRRSAEATLVGLSLTVAGALAGFALSGRADVQILVALPLIFGVVTVLVQRQTATVAIAGSYIRTVLTPLIRELTMDRRVFGREDYYRSIRGDGSGARGLMNPIIAGQLVLPLLSLGISAVIIANIQTSVGWLTLIAGSLVAIFQLGQGLRRIVGSS